VRVDVGETWVAVHRGAFTILVNLAPEPAELAATGEVVLTWGEVTPSGADQLRLPPDGVAVLRG
jgi:hypothetical protein